MYIKFIPSKQVKGLVERKTQLATLGNIDNFPIDILIAPIIYT